MCKEQKLSDLTANVVTMQVNNILKNLPNDGTKYSPEQVQEIFVKEAAFFENSVMRDQIFKLFTLKLNVETELHTMEHRFEEIEKQERKSRTRIFSLMTCWFTTQFFLSGYCIYFVPWLGWDLVEPLTYTVTQGSCIGGLVYMYRNRYSGVEFTDLD